MSKKRRNMEDPEIPQGFREVLMSCPGVAVLRFSSDGIVTDYDDDGERIFGFRPEGVLGQTCQRLIPDRGRFIELIHRALASGNPQKDDFVALSKKREAIYTHVCVNRAGESTDEVWAIFHEYTESERLRREIEEMRERGRQTMHQSEKEAEFLRELLRHTNETIKIGLAVQDIPSGMIAYVNESFEEITGIDRLRTLGMTFGEIFADFPATRDCIVDYVKRLTLSVGNEYVLPPPENWKVRMQSGEKEVEVYGRPIVVEGHENQYLLLIIEDNTERRRLQTQLVQSEKLAAVGQLAAGIAHEIRNPLNTIYNALYDLTEIIHDPSEEVREDISISMDEIKRVQDIINNLLDFARESERSSGITNLNDVIGKTIRLVRHDLNKKSVSIQMELSEIPDVAFSNNALKQILINLITNAAQAMAEGGALRISTFLRSDAPKNGGNPATGAHHRLGTDTSMRADNEMVILVIEDNGPGIPPDVLPSIFNPFYTTKPPGSGTGLGLSVVHSLVSDAGGAISVNSEVGSGTTFTLELPVYVDA